MADQMFESMWSDNNIPDTSHITEGPLAQFTPGYDPILEQQEKRAAYEKEYTEKTARIVGSNNNAADTSVLHGRVTQQGDNYDDEVINREIADAPVSKPQVVTSAPSKGTKGLVSRIRAKKTRSIKPDPIPEETKQAPPSEKEPSNLSDGSEKSSWTGSGSEAALHDDKVASLLKEAGVPASSASMLLRELASQALEKTASGPDYFARTDIHPLKLMAELEDTLGEEWKEWEPETISESIVKEAGVTPSDEVMSKIMAVKIVVNRPDVFFDDWMGFEKISVALNNKAPIMGMIEDVPVEWMSNAVSIVNKIVEDGDFGEDVAKYAAARMHDQGYAVAPPLLRFADSRLGEMVSNDNLRKKVILAYAKAVNTDKMPEHEDPVSIQVARLIRNNAFVLDSLNESRNQIG